ncbi:MAG: GntR family transcriptional regulator [Gemmatimonadales bacterium]|nr:MAG: GntR family transcriptional regulator [Gemmatimonadales bacterium]
MLVIDTDSPTPPYEQVRAQVVALVRSGDLAPGTRLPTVRRLAGDLGLATNTVARAYRELERAGIVETRGRHGTFVGPDVDSAAEAALDAAAAFAARVDELGLAPSEGLRLAARALGLPPDGHVP